MDVAPAWERGLKLTGKNCYNVEQLWVAKQTIRKKCLIMQEVLEKDYNSIIITSTLVSCRKMHTFS